MGKVIEFAGGLISFVAGLYLLTAHSTSAIPGGSSWFEILAHGIGIYFIARAVWMFGHVGREDGITGRLDRLIELATLEHQPPEGETTP